MNSIEHVALDPNYHWRIRLLADAIHEVLGVRDAVDIGCGEGMLAARLAEHGWKIQGADGSPEAVAGCVPGVEVKLHDLAKPGNPAGRHECVICTETAEHIPQEFADNVVANVTASGRTIMVWSAAKPGQVWPGHVNLQPSQYWLEKLASYGWKINEAKTVLLRERMVALGAQHASASDNFCVLERAACLVVVSTCFKSPTEEKCRASVQMQTLRVPHVFIDAALQVSPKTHTENLYDAVKDLHPDDVVIQLDGDDWLAHPRVLEQIAGLYQDPEVWLTYGSVLMTDGTYNGNNMPYAPDEDIRTSRWRCSHLKTFRAGLFQRINPEDLMFEGDWAGYAVDHATMFPMVEMAGWDRTRWVKEAIYVYNFENSVEFSDARRNAIACRVAEFFRGKPRYSRLSDYSHSSKLSVAPMPVVPIREPYVKSSKMKIHILGVPHTKTTEEFSTCAFTQKTLTLCKMLTRRGHHVIHYGVEGSNPECTENVDVMPHDVWAKQFGHPGKEFYKVDVSGEFAPYHARYAANLRSAILNRTGDPFTEIICHPWNGTQPQATEGIPQYRVESGIGYRGAWAPWRVYESYAWLHMHLGEAGKWNGAQWYWNVIPNAFDLAQFSEPKSQRSGDFLYLGRLNFDKGVGIACDTAKAVGARITIVGQGDPTPYLAPHVRYRPPVGIEERKELLANARALFAPTIYVEPFGSTHVEAMLSGVPVITSDWGVFPETNLHGITGYRCRTMEQFAWAARNIDRIDGRVAAKWARDNFAMERVVLQYEEFFDQCLRVRDMNGPVDGPTGFYGLNPERTELDSLRRYYPGYDNIPEQMLSAVEPPAPLPQISFVVRAHNEEASLRESITSLFAIEPPIEVVVILHRCTDGSKEIALACQAEAPARHRVKIVEYEVPVSRAGLETLVTPEDSRHSIMSYYDWAFSQASAAWRFKWDADFVTTPGLVAWIDGRDWALQDSRAMNVPHRSPDGVVGREPYLHNCLRHFVKADFWEVPMFPGNFVLEEVPDDAAFVHASRLSEVKTYWHGAPWFFDVNVAETYSAEAAELRDAYVRAVAVVGPEPVGVARSDNPECHAYLDRCRKMLQNGAAVHETASP